MARWLVLASVLWPALAASTIWQRASGPPAGWTTVVYLAAARVCHQLSARSFHTAGVQWPVCGRCSGLYLGAAIGGLFAAARRRRTVARHRALTILSIASLPTVATLALEWSGVPVGNLARALAALPAGFTIAAALIGVAATGRKKAIR